MVEFIGLRETINDLVDKNFESLDRFFDIIENDSAGPKFDCVHSNGENASDSEVYIIDRETGKYINWYKLYHIGRDAHTNCESYEEIERFFENLKKASEEPWND